MTYQPHYASIDDENSKKDLWEDATKDVVKKLNNEIKWIVIYADEKTLSHHTIADSIDTTHNGSGSGERENAKLIIWTILCDNKFPRKILFEQWLPECVPFVKLRCRCTRLLIVAASKCEWLTDTRRGAQRTTTLWMNVIDRVVYLHSASRRKVVESNGNFHSLEENIHRNEVIDRI